MKSSIYALRLTACVGVAMMLTACAGAFPGNPQGYAGITKAEVHFEDGVLSEAIIYDGKEKQDVELIVDLTDGTASYRAAGSQAFEGQALRAQVEEAVSSNLADVAPEVVTSVVDAVMTAVTGDDE